MSHIMLVEPSPSRLLNPSEAPTADEDSRINERLRRYFSDFAAAYIRQEVRRTGKSLGTVVEELLTERVLITERATPR